jgi:hypothetical protein
MTEKSKTIEQPKKTEIVEALADSGQYMKRRDIMGDSGIKYRIAIRKSDGRWCCSCPHWRNVQNKKGLDCKHLDRLKAEFGVHFADGLDVGKVTMLSTLKSMLTMSGDALLQVWMVQKEKIFLMEDYLRMTDDGEATQEYCGILEQVKTKVMGLISV